MTTKYVNPENPYVFNEFFFEHDNPFQFNGSTYSIVHRILNTLAPLLGILAASLLAYLAMFKTPIYFKPFARMLLICSIFDISICVFDLMCQNRFQITKEALIFSLTGPVSLLSYQSQCTLASLKSAAQTQGYLILPFQYIFRWKTIKRNTPPSILFIIVYLFICFLAFLCGFWSTRIAFCSFENPNQIDFGQYWYKESKIPILLVEPTNYSPTLYQNIFFVATTWSTFVVAIVFSRLTIRELRRHALHMRARTLTMQKELGRALFAQCLVPLVTIVSPTVIGQISMSFEINLGYFTDIYSTMMSFYPFLNSLCTIFFIQHYRQFCSRLFCFRFKSPVHPISDVVNLNTSNTANLNMRSYI